MPRDAVNVGEDSSFVYVVTGAEPKDGQKKTGKNGDAPQFIAVSKPVKVLNDDGANDAIQGDVKPGDTVIIDGQLRVTSGSTVAIQKNTGQQPAAPPPP